MAADSFFLFVRFFGQFMYGQFMYVSDCPRPIFFYCHTQHRITMDFDLADLVNVPSESVMMCDEDMYMFQQSCLMVVKQMDASEFDAYEMQQVLTEVCANVSCVQEHSVWLCDDEEESVLALFPTDPFNSFMD